MRIRTAVTLFLLLFSGFLSLPASARAAYYVSDYFEITLRTGPSGDNKIIAMLGSDTRLEILSQQEGWAQVRTPDGKEGWVLLRYISDQTPKRKIIDELEKKVETVTEECKEPAKAIADLRSRNDELKQSLDTTNKDLNQAKIDNASLRNLCANAVNIDKQYQQATADIHRLKGELSLITKENETLRSKSDIQWFLAGAAVVGLSWLFGYLAGRARRQKRRQSLFS